MLTIQKLSYTHFNNEFLFRDIDIKVNPHEKISVIGNNGVGKSTLLKIIASLLPPSEGVIHLNAAPYYVPQLVGQFNDLTIAQALQVDEKLKALTEILGGNVSEENFSVLNEDWAIEERCEKALRYWGLPDFDLSTKIETLSGGQKTRVFLAGIFIHKPQLVLLDEPSNHLDFQGRAILYEFIENTKSALIIVSHDRRLLNLTDTTCELSKTGIKVYGGNFDFYKKQKHLLMSALNQDIHGMEKALRRAKEKERETVERQQKLDVRAKKNLGKAGLPKIVSNTLKNSSEKSTSKIKAVHADKTASIRQELRGLRSSLSDIDQMKLGFDDAEFHTGKKIIAADRINFSYENGAYLWREDLCFQIVGGERVNIKGINGSGKTTLIKIILGELTPHVGSISVTDSNLVYIDQDISQLSARLSTYDQVQHFNTLALQEHEIKTRLNRFLFKTEDCIILPKTRSSG